MIYFNSSCYHKQITSSNLSHCCHIFPGCVPERVVPYYAVGFIYILGKLGFLSFIAMQSYHVYQWWSTLWSDGRICLFARHTIYHYHHYADVSESILKFLNSYQVNSVSNMCLRLSPFSQLSLMKYMDGLCVFSSPFSLVIVRICVLYLLIIIKSEVWPICHCLGVGHEIMVHAVWLFIFLSIGPQGNLSEMIM